MAALIDSWLSAAQDALGVPAGGLRLLLTSFLVFPIILVHRWTLHGKNANVQHVYFTLCGLLLVYFNFGPYLVHGIINVVLLYAVLLTLGGSAASVAVCFSINLGYLLACYWVTKTEAYDISWSIPQCVLTLRLTGLSWDVYDGRMAAAAKKKQDGVSSVPDTALQSCPSLLEVFGYCYFTPCFMVGPQFPMSRYLDFVHGKFSDKASSPLCSRQAGLRTAAGVGYIVLYALLCNTFPSSYLISDDFQEKSFIYKTVFVLVWGQVLLLRYLGFWLLAEGGCIIAGIAYNGTDASGNDQWNACANVCIRKFHLAVTFHDLVDSFNVNTNQWMLKYVYKRLRFLGNRQLSHVVTLFYLAIWHGHCTGYFMNFFLEFLMVSCERDIRTLLENHATLRHIVNNRYLRPLLCLCSKFIVSFSLAYSLVGFDLLHYKYYKKVYQGLHYSLHILFLLWPVAYVLIKKMFPTSVNADKSQTGGKKAA